MATPHLVGVGALYSTWIITNSTAGVITGNGNGTPNRLLFKSTL